MHYYQHNIGDYARDTSHLSMLEHGIYRTLLDWCYLNEKPITTEKAIRLSRGNPVETQSVLSEFFVGSEEGWTHARVVREIEKFHLQAEKNRVNGGKGGRPRTKNNPVGFQSVPSGNPVVTLTNNQEPITNNQKIKNNSSADAEPVVQPDMSAKQTSPPAELVRETVNEVRQPVFEVRQPDTNHQEPSLTVKRKKNTKEFTAEGLDFKSWPSEASPNVLTEWLALRKRKKASVTQLVVDQFGEVLHQAAAIGWTVDEALSKAVMRGWQGLEIDWLPPKAGGIAPQSRPASKQMQGLEAIFNAGKNYGMDGTGSSKGLGPTVHALPRIHARIGNDRGDDSGMDRRDPIEGDLV